MLERFRIMEKIQAVNANNTTSNDMQTIKLTQLDNMFKEENRVRCFNHTLQLLAKSLLKPFNTALSASAANDDAAPQDVDNDKPAVYMDDEDERGQEGEEEEEGGVEDDIEDDNVDELQALSRDERERVLGETAVVCESVTKVHILTKAEDVHFCTNFMYRCNNCRLLSFILLPLLSLHGAASATRSTSRNDSSPVML
jgi:hypothetical protein